MFLIIIGIFGVNWWSELICVFCWVNFIELVVKVFSFICFIFICILVLFRCVFFSFFFIFVICMEFELFWIVVWVVILLFVNILWIVFFNCVYILLVINRNNKRLNNLFFFILKIYKVIVIGMDKCVKYIDCFWYSIDWNYYICIWICNLKV